MMEIKLSVPGKTFLLGEYGVLEGGPALLVATAPRFVLEVVGEGSGTCEGIHPHSPAGQWVRRYSHLFQNCHLRFRDPYLERGIKGGLGASSAQFLMVYCWGQMSRYLPQKWSLQLNTSTVLQAYLEILREVNEEASYSKSKSSKSLWLPSGSDVMAQWQGSVTLFHPQPFSLKRKEEIFPELAFSLFKTPFKIATHQHLNEGVWKKNHFQDLIALAQEGCRAWEEQVEKKWIDVINEFSHLLAQKNLLHPQVADLLAKMRALPEVLAVKGCGALGADTVVVFHRPLDQVRDQIQQKTKELGLSYIGGEADISEGLKMEWNPRIIPTSENDDQMNSSNKDNQEFELGFL